MGSPGWVVTLTRPEADGELAALEDAERLAAAGALDTDVAAAEGELRAFGLFEAPPPGMPARRLPDAEPCALPSLERRPVRLGGVELREGPPGPGALAIRGGDAFGSGLHPTTAMMLTLIGRAPTPRAVLDVGTGTGVLALAALVRGAERAVGTDVASRSRDAARDNARRNRLEARFEATELIPPGRFDLVLANIRPRALVALAPHLSAATALDGRLLLSGIRFCELEPVEAAYAAAGRVARTRLFAGGFWCVETRRAFASDAPVSDEAGDHGARG